MGMEGQEMMQPIGEVGQSNSGDFDKGNNRWHGLDFVKVIATILIVLHHYWQAHNVYINDGVNFFNGKKLRLRFRILDVSSIIWHSAIHSAVFATVTAKSFISIP